MSEGLKKNAVVSVTLTGEKIWDESESNLISALDAMLRSGFVQF